MLAKMHQNFLARKHLEFALNQNWWERQLRGFEAQLPPTLMTNLYKVFKTAVLSKQLEAEILNVSVHAKVEDEEGPARHDPRQDSDQSRINPFSKMHNTRDSVADELL